MCFASGDKKSVCARSHLNVSCKEYDGFVIWWYELVSNNWFKGPMISPKCVCGVFFCFLFLFLFYPPPMALVLLLLAALEWKIEGSGDLSGHGILPSRLAHGFSTSQRAWSNRELSLKNMIFVFMVF